MVRKAAVFLSCRSLCFPASRRGEESLDFSCLHWEICQREKNRVGKARNISCIPPGIFEQSLAFTMSQRDWTWMRSEKKGEQE